MPYTRAELLEAVRADHPQLKNVNDNELFAAIAQDHPDLAKGIAELQGGNPSGHAREVPWYSGYFNQSNDPSRTASEVASDQAANNLKGVPQAITSIPSMMDHRGEITEPKPGKFPSWAKPSAANPLATVGKQAVELAKPGLVNAPSPDAPETAQAAQGAGAMLAGAELPNVLGAAGALVNRAKAALAKTSLPENLQTRATVNRSPLPALTPADVARDAVTTGVGGGIGAAVGGPAGAAAGAGIVEGANLLRRSNLYRGAKAALQNRSARWLAGSHEPQHLTLPEADTETPPSVDVPPMARQDTAVSTARDVANASQDEARRMIGTGTTAKQPLDAGAPTSTPYPSNPINAMVGEAVPPTPADAPSINRWMQVKPKDMIHGANPGEQVLKENLIGPTKEATRANVKAALTDAGQSMEDKLKAASQQGIIIDAEPHVMNALTKATKRIGLRTDQAFQSQLSNVLDDILAEFPDLKTLTPDQAHAMKVRVGDSIKWNGTAYEGEINQVLRDIYQGLNGDIKTSVPGISDDMARWGNLYQANKALKQGITNDLAGRGTGGQPPTMLDRVKQLRAQRVNRSPGNHSVLGLNR